jgi:hypothetical protein
LFVIQLCKDVPVTTKNLLDESFSMWSVSYQRKAGDWFFPQLLAIFPAKLSISYSGGTLFGISAGRSTGLLWLSSVPPKHDVYVINSHDNSYPRDI